MSFQRPLCQLPSNIVYFAWKQGFLPFLDPIFKKKGAEPDYEEEGDVEAGSLKKNDGEEEEEEQKKSEE